MDFITLSGSKKSQLERIVLNIPGSVSEVLVGAELESAGDMLPEHGVVIITDDNVLRIYGDRFPRFPVFSIKPGEESKKLSTVEDLAGRLMEAGIDRDGFILAIGGGVVCDIAGFLGSNYMRGIRFAYVSTTLLSQVDASTGGKNGVNAGHAKNMLGCFNQPEFVICDTGMLATLPEDEYLSGLAELIKTGIIGDEKLFEVIENSSYAVMQRDRELLTFLVSLSVNFKASVVVADEKETGIRRILNFGHTYGHAIEMHASFLHGFAVASGMELAAAFSHSRGMLHERDLKRIVSLLEKTRLLKEYDMPPDLVDRYISRDKKKSGSDIHFVFVGGIGRASSEKVPVGEVVDFYKDFYALRKADKS